LIVEVDVAHGTFIEGNVDDAVDLIGSRHGSKVGFMSLAASGLVALLFAVLAAKRVGLAIVLPVPVAKLLTKFCNLVLQLRDAAVALLATGARRTVRSHGPLL
jgi:hypothetical protein